MEEGRVTVDGTTHPLPQPFLVLATQNQIEYEGTFPLPEAQLDRFLLHLHLGYPEEVEEVEMLERLEHVHPLTSLTPVMGLETVSQLQAAVKEVYVAREVKEYLVRLARHTRQHPLVSLGASPRASIALMRAAQALAYFYGRPYVTPDDIQDILQPVLGHRLLLTPQAHLEGVTPDGVLEQVLQAQPAPF